MYNRLKPVEPAQYFGTADAQQEKVVLILPDTDLNRKHHWVQEEPVYGVIGVLYNNYRSEIVFLTNRIFIDEYGNPDTVDNLVFFGEMGNQRLGEMLPMEYRMR